MNDYELESATEWAGEQHLFPQGGGFVHNKEEIRQLQENDPLLYHVLAEFPRQVQLVGPWARNPPWLAIKKVWHQLVMEDGVLCRKRPAVGDQGQSKKVLVLLSTLVLDLLEQCHDMAGHFGLEKTLGKVSERFWWPGYTHSNQ